MKGFLVFLTVALVASSASATALSKNERGPIEDALATIKCLRETVAQVQDNINEIAATVTGLNDIIASNLEKLNKCMAIGGDNPTINDQMAAAQCVIDLGNSFKVEILGLVDKINADIASLIATGQNVIACF